MISITFDTIFSFAFLSATLRASTPLILATMGGLLTELCGVINIALEGLMLIGAFFGVISGAYFILWFPNFIWLAPWVGMFCGILSAVGIAWVLAFFHLELGADLILSGIGINVLAGGLTVFLMFVLIGDKGSTSTLISAVLPSIQIPLANEIPLLGSLINGDSGSGYNVLTYIAFLSVGFVSVLLFKTSLGKNLRAVGENEEAARSVGIDVKRIKYQAILLSGVLAGLGGIYLSMGYLSFFQANMTAGRGFIALAAIYLGARHPIGVMFAALLFGATSALEPRLALFDIPSELVAMVPAVVTVCALVAHSLYTQRKSRSLARKIHKLNEVS
ncbi:ABC transporter permease [Vibrio mediterranei]|uniref:ABC transporter permease n=1 Tax=Vibrio mediterranei TaxID=689 RepID=UPI001EFE3A81|nr:ABC transporter permease [Vibrio mediterranei]MCG9627470.1 ABC transporter permease [Vibrio mediterranei]